VIPLHIKKLPKYKEYIKDILEYIKKFFIRTHPLIDYNKIHDNIDEDFDKDWPNIPGWEMIKSDNIIYCYVCLKSFTNKQVYEHHKKGKTHLKNIEKNTHKVDQNEINLIEEDENLREIAYFEFQILRFKELLSEVYENTKNLIRKKQSMNLDEIEADVIDEKELDQIEFDDEEEKKIYNPKNVPLGWDGK
jgi:splicing factor 3A subunit 3